MANQHNPYAHPGPSNYYPHSPPPPFYGPGPGIPYYPQYPVPPMNGHASNYQPTSPRMNGVGRGGYHPHRAGGPSYQHFQHVPPQHFVPPQPMTPSPISPASPYAHPQKYPQHPHQVPYSPSYHPPPNGPYPHWASQPLSPLPKQLSMLPPPQPVIHEPPQPQSSVPQLPHSTAPIVQAPRSPTSPPQNEPEPQPELEPAPEPEPAVETPTPPRSLSPPLDETSQTVDERPVTPDSPAPTADNGPAGWVIWSRKGHPSLAPGIIISPRANPPPDVVQKALQLPSPPPSPKVRAKVTLPLVLEGSLPQAEAKEESPEPIEVSSSATETTPACSTAPDTPVPGSPLSTNTSVSLAAASPALSKSAKALSPSINKDEALPDEVSSAVNEEKAAESSSLSEVASEVAPVTAPEPVQAAPVASSSKPAPPVKKSWASLLQSSDTPASSSKSRLPTSNVVGFSIPASANAGTSSQSSRSSSSIPARPELLNLLSQGPTGPAVAPKIRPRGLINTGNMCFANAVLQVLVYCPPFHRLFNELGKHLQGPVAGSQKEGGNGTPLVDAIIQFLKEFTPPESKPSSNSKGKEREEDFDELDSFIPTYVYDVMKEKKRFASMVGGHQEDAEEFLGFFLDTLEEELLLIFSSISPKSSKSSGAAEEPAEEAHPHDEGWLEVGKKNRAVMTRTIKSAESPITRIFGGKFRSTLRAPHQRDSVTIEDWRSLRLDIQRDQIHSIKDALQLISTPSSVQITSPTRPGVIIDASQQTLIESLPPILILHMKRFHYDTSVGDVVKIGKQVAYGPDLEISPELIAPSARKAQPVKYQLFGVLYHHGQSAHGGHYTLDVLHPNRDMNDKPRPAWIRIDDELVSDVRPDDVFGGFDRDDRCAYLLFYRRIGAGIPTRPWSQLASAA
ncbi:hypothetical protein C8Q75DRAFT_738539 [Abortiporus biennis]|nr:hypothetical protein C8Q75DRAFT_738539 [Abortiporus biennis]